MNRRDADRIPLYQRIRDTPTPEHVRAPAEPEAPGVRHCWVLTEHGRLPGLLVEWRRTRAGWQGRVVRPVCQSGAWVLAEDWISAEMLTPA
ncbi:MAG TPA: hypothetical protein VH228_16020 [Nocardioides sp.]|jgi:hypothetical protein|nr:hypothetical protein [Nocardioides sp.]